MAPTAIPLAKQVLRELSAADVARVAARALRAPTAADVETELTEFLAPQAVEALVASVNETR